MNIEILKNDNFREWKRRERETVLYNGVQIVQEFSIVSTVRRQIYNEKINEFSHGLIIMHKL